jgi:hypothetical protein
MIDALPPEHRVALDALGVDCSAVCAVLLANATSDLPDKVVDGAAADLFVALRQPGPVPDGAGGVLAALVLDHVLEVETADGYASGPSTYHLLSLPSIADVARTPAGRLGRLSADAVAYAERLHLTDVNFLTARLYSYNCVPLSRRWARAYPDPSAVLDVVPRWLTKHWLGGEPDDGADWISWVRRGAHPEARSGDFPYKLYVSPLIEDIPDVLSPLVGALTDSGAARFKIGADATGLLRPDKIVAYLVDAAELGRVADAVGDALEGAAPHGVPFSAELGGDGLLSWGGDPPHGDAPVGAAPESWRLSLCRRLAEYLVAGITAGPPPALPGRPPGRPSEYALARLAIDGVDVRSFAPATLPPPRATQLQAT